MAFTSTNKTVRPYQNNPELAQDKGGSVADLIDELQSGAAGSDVISGTTQAAAASAHYLANNASLVTITLPTVATVGSRIRVVGLGAGGWKVAQNANQIIHKSATASTTGTGGSIASGNRYNAVDLECIVANTEWSVVNSEGTLTIV